MSIDLRPFQLVAAEQNARNELLRAALRVLDAERGDESDPHFGDELDYAQEGLALAARDLADAVNQMPADQQPVGWARTFCERCDKPMPLPDSPDDRRRALWCENCVAEYRAANPQMDEAPF
jgi:hypothetical protein